MLSFALFVATVENVVFISVSWLSLQTYRKLNNMRHQMSEKTKRMQSHFNIMLAAQVC